MQVRARAPRTHCVVSGLPHSIARGVLAGEWRLRSLWLYERPPDREQGHAGDPFLSLGAGKQTVSRVRARDSGGRGTMPAVRSDVFVRPDGGENRIPAARRTQGAPPGRAAKYRHPLRAVRDTLRRSPGRPVRRHLVSLEPGDNQGFACTLRRPVQDRAGTRRRANDSYCGYANVVFGFSRGVSAWRVRCKRDFDD